MAKKASKTRGKTTMEKVGKTVQTAAKSVVKTTKKLVQRAGKAMEPVGKAMGMTKGAPKKRKSTVASTTKRSAKKKAK